MKRSRKFHISAADYAQLSAVPQIEALPRAEQVPLSLPQQQRWVSSSLKDASQACHIQVGLRLRGKLHQPALQSALNGLVARHEILRTTFGVDQGEPFQRIAPADLGMPMNTGDVPAATEGEGKLAELMSREAQVMFDLDAGPLIRGRLWSLATSDHILQITMHNMIADEQSRTILTRELSELYSAVCDHRVNQLAPLPVQYADYALWQRRWRKSLKRESEYSGSMLTGVPMVLTGGRGPRISEWQDYRRSCVEFDLGEALTSQLRSHSRRLKITMFTILLTGWTLVIARLSGQDEVVIGTSTANRARPEIAGLIGPFAKTLGLRIDVSDDPTLGSLLEQVDAVNRRALLYQDLFEDACGNPLLNQPHIGVFQPILALQNNAAETAEWSGLKPEFVGASTLAAQHSPAFAFSEEGPTIRGRLIYTTPPFERNAVEPFVNYLQQALRQMGENLGQRLWSARLRFKEEPHRIRIKLTSVEAALQARLTPELIKSVPPAERAVMKFIEGTLIVSSGDLQANSVTRYQATKFYRDLITNGGYYDQLRRIVEPSFEEFKSPGNLDTSGEHDNTVVPGFQHKYAQTGLLLVTDRCASYCRYCFRKRIVGKDSDEIAADFAQVAQYIRGHPEMTNILLSGGDPFVLSTGRLNEILDYLLPFPHLNSIRFGTKMVAYDPKRFEDPALPTLFQRIRAAGKTAVIVVHFDHIGEVSADAERNILALRAQGVQFLNQSVLLGKVNDEAEILAATFAKCHKMGVRPYYLFQGRPVKGASHFQVPLRRGLEIVHGINQKLSGIQKTFRYIMAHYTGKIEILDLGADDRLYMRYHQNKASERIGKIFSRPYIEGACWLDDLPE